MATSRKLDDFVTAKWGYEGLRVAAMLNIEQSMDLNEMGVCECTGWNKIIPLSLEPIGKPGYGPGYVHFE